MRRPVDGRTWTVTSRPRRQQRGVSRIARRFEVLAALRDAQTALRTGLALSCLGLVSCAGSVQAPRGAETASPGELLPTRVRLLSNRELERSVGQLLGSDSVATGDGLARRLPPDVRQSGYTPNAGRALTAAAGARWNALVEELAERAATRSPTAIDACRDDDCARREIHALAFRAWRRPVTETELDALHDIFRSAEARAATGATGSDSKQGLRSLLSALMLSPSFLYVTELGEIGSGDLATLTQFEIASALSFTLSGAPPDAQLLALAESGSLDDPQTRREQARRILGHDSTRTHFERFVLEWLEVDALQETAKTEESHPTYEALKSRMLDETRAFVDEVMVHRGASVQALLTAGFVSVPPAMARYYELDAFGPAVPVGDSGRLGILQHASFLAAHAHPDGTSPVRRGDFVLRKLLCKRLPRPAELGIEVSMPAPTADQTTRSRFVAHNADPQCKTCHQSIDPLGFTFENFDEAGRLRTREAGQTVETQARLSLDGQRLQFGDSRDLSRWLAANADVTRCFARQAFRYFSAQSEPATEAPFVRLQTQLPGSARGNLIELLVAYAGSDAFVTRRRSR